jgi:DNA invertase Pin-like site-specific DNA recombinase
VEKGKTMTRRVALYVRVSTDGQTTENQRAELEETAKRHGWRVVSVFQDRAISGAKPRDQRPAMRKLMEGVGRRDFDMVAAWSVDRLGRSLQDLVGFLGEIHAKGVDLYLHQQGIDTSTPAGKAMFQMMGVFAEFERAMIVERVKAGIKRVRAEISRARAAGEKPTKTLGRPKVDAKTEAAIRTSVAAGNGILKTAKLVGCGSGTVQRVRKEMLAAGPSA